MANARSSSKKDGWPLCDSLHGVMLGCFMPNELEAFGLVMQNYDSVREAVTSRHVHNRDLSTFQIPDLIRRLWEDFHELHKRGLCGNPPPLPASTSTPFTVEHTMRIAGQWLNSEAARQEAETLEPHVTLNREQRPFAQRAAAFRNYLRKAQASCTMTGDVDPAAHQAGVDALWNRFRMEIPEIVAPERPGASSQTEELEAIDVLLGALSAAAGSTADSLEELLESLPRFLSAPELAKVLKRAPGGIESSLRRYRSKHPDCYVTNDEDDRRRNEPKYQYRTKEVLPYLWRKYCGDVTNE